MQKSIKVKMLIGFGDRVYPVKVYKILKLVLIDFFCLIYFFYISSFTFFLI